MSASAAFDAANDRVGKHPPDKDENFAEAASHDDGHQEEASGKDESASDSEDDTNSGVYCGEYDRNGLPHGQGTKDYSNGDKFVGIWHHGRRKSGTLHYNDGNLGRKFVGDFDLNEDRVKGKVVFPSGSVFEGEFAEDRIVFGKFKYVDKSGGEEFYQGSFKGGHRNGHGTYIFENGSVYVGNWAENEQNGQGTMTRSNGVVMEGHWKDGELSKGTVKYRNGDVYHGDLKDDVRRHGSGVYRYKFSGDTYVGGWSDGKQEGEGTMIYANGARYEGEWRGGSRHGQGKMIFKNANVFEGEWENDKENGKGTCKWGTGASFTGTWQDGRMKKGNMLYSDGNEYRGELHDKQRNGQGCMHFIDKSSYNGVWSNNKRHSSGQLTLPNGCMADLVYSHGTMRSSIRHCLYQGPLPLDDAICKAVADEIVRTKQCPGISTDVAMHAVRQRHPGVLDDPERRNLVQARLVSRAVHYLDALIDTKREPKAAIEFARDLAGPIYMLDQFEIAHETLKDSSYLAFMDGVNGCDRRLLKFYAKRFRTCSCMQALYNNARDEHTKTGLCSLCGKIS